MASVKTSGLDELMLSMKECADLPDDVADEMLQVSGKIVAEAQRRKIRSTLGTRTGVLANSVTVSKMKTRKANERYVTVYPQGKHHTTVKGKVVTNNEIVFVHEYGAPKRNIRAKGIIRSANEESAEQATAAQYKVYDQWLQSKDL